MSVFFVNNHLREHEACDKPGWEAVYSLRLQAPTHGESLHSWEVTEQRELDHYEHPHSFFLSPEDPSHPIATAPEAQDNTGNGPVLQYDFMFKIKFKQVPCLEESGPWDASVFGISKLLSQNSTLFMQTNTT